MSSDLSDLDVVRDAVRLQLHLAGMDLRIWRLELERRVRRVVGRACARLAYVRGELLDLRDRVLGR